MTTARVVSPEHVEAGPDLRLVTEAAPEYGRWQQASLPVDKIITVSQTRPAANPEHERLVESIATNGLINPLDVAVLSRDRLVDYLDFVKETWGDKTDIDELTPDDSGNYYLLMAGHSRLAAINELEWQRQLRSVENHELFQSANVICKLHPQPTPAEIVAIQLAENIHDKPPAERAAMVLVENYRYGQRHGMWSTKSEYLQSQEGKFSKYALDQALHFANLPARVRDFTFAGGLSYQAAIELGKQRDLLVTYFSERFAMSDPFEIDEQVDIWYGRHVLDIKSDWPVAKVRSFVEQSVAVMKEFLAEDSPEQMLNFMISPAEQARQYRDQQLRAYRKELLQLESRPLVQWQKVVKLHHAIAGVKPAPERLEAAHERATNAAASVGASALALELA